jgi:hypothetical protein
MLKLIGYGGLIYITYKLIKMYTKKPTVQKVIAQGSQAPQYKIQGNPGSQEQAKLPESIQDTKPNLIQDEDPWISY